MLPIEIISNVARLLSLTVRLWVNMFVSELLYGIFLGLMLEMFLYLEKIGTVHSGRPLCFRCSCQSYLSCFIFLSPYCKPSSLRFFQLFMWLARLQRSINTGMVANSVIPAA